MSEHCGCFIDVDTNVLDNDVPAETFLDSEHCRYPALVAEVERLIRESETFDECTVSYMVAELRAAIDQKPSGG